MFKTTARALALLLALLPAMAGAQQFPSTFPASSVYGRIGSAGVSGPGGAIPFATLAAQLAPTLSPLIGATFSVKAYGAKGDGITDDSSAFAAASSACASAGGGQVQVPPTGHPYLVNTGFSLSNGCSLVGAGTRVYAGSTATIAQWAQAGSWIQCGDTVNACVTLGGNGSGMDGINFIHSQPVPGGTWTPTIYPYTVDIKGTFVTVNNVMSVGASHDIWVDYTAGSGGGTYTRLTNIYTGAFVNDVKFSNVNDTMYLANLRHRNNYYSSNSLVVAYMYSNRICWDVNYLDNPQINGVEFFQCSIGMRFTDATVGSNTHSLYNGQLDSISFNLVKQAAVVAANTTTVKFTASNVLAQQDTGDGYFNTLFDFSSNNADVRIGQLSVPGTGGTIFNIGGGTGGALQITNTNVLSYGALSSGAVGFNVAAGANLYIPTGSLNITAGSGAGAIFSGSGTVNYLPAVPSMTASTVYGGSAAGSTLTLQSTSNGSPSGDSVALKTGGAARATILSNGNVGIGTETNPTIPLMVSQNAQTGITTASSTVFSVVGADGMNSGITQDTYSNGVNAFGQMVGRTARGTGASPANLQSGDGIYQFITRPYVNGAFAGSATSRLFFGYNDTSPNLGTFLEIDATPAGGTARNQAMRLQGGVIIGTGTTDPGVGNLTIGGGYACASPSTKTSAYSQVSTDCSLIFNGSGSITLTLLAASSWPGKILWVRTIAAQTVVSASSNVVPLAGGAASTAILAGTAGKWAMLQSDGTNWQIMASN